MKLTPLNQRRLALFKAHKRGWWSLWIFLALFVLSLGAELIANDKPIVVRFDGGWYFPVFERYPETTFGGEFPLQANYKGPYIQELIEAKGGWMIWPPIPSTIPASITTCRSPRQARHRWTTGSAPTIRAVTCWRG